MILDLFTWIGMSDERVSNYSYFLLPLN